MLNIEFNGVYDMIKIPFRVEINIIIFAIRLPLSYEIFKKFNVFFIRIFFLMILNDFGISAGSINANFLILKDNSLVVFIRVLSVKLNFFYFSILIT